MNILSGGSQNRYLNVWTYDSAVMEKKPRTGKEMRTMRRYLLRTSALMSVQKLKELKSLLNQGLITEAQYQAESQKILNQLVE
jgi:hypothetical protein